MIAYWAASDWNIKEGSQERGRLEQHNTGEEKGGRERGRGSRQLGLA